MEEPRSAYSSNGGGDVFDNFQDIHLKDVINILSARKNVVLYTLAIFLVAAVAYVFLTRPMYTSHAKLLIEPTKVNLGEIQEVYDPTLSGMGGALMIREYFDTQLKLILNRSSLEKTFNAIGYDRFDEFRGSKDQIKEFENYFRVKDVRNTRLVEVSYAWYDPVVAKETLRYLLNEYIASNNGRAMGVTMEGLEILRLKAKDLAPRVDATGEAMQKFMVDNNMISLEETQNIVVEKLKQINAELVRTENEKIQYGSVVESLKSIRSGKVSLESIPEAGDNQVVRDLKLQQSRVLQDLSSLEGRYGASHPEVVSLRSQLSTIRSKLNSELKNIIKSAEQKYRRASSQTRDLLKALAEQEKKVHKLNQLSTEYKKLKEDNDTLKETYRVVDKRIKEIEISLAAGPKSSNIFIIEPPTLPQAPSHPNPVKVLIAALIGGLLLGVIICFFAEYYDTTIKSQQEAENITGFPVLGIVPPVDAQTNGASQNGQDMFNSYKLSHWEDNRSMISEAFRSIRTALEFFAPNEKKVFLVTSGAPSEGKTTTSLHVAMSFARAGKKTLIVDADMRKPRLGKIFKVHSMSGLSAILREALMEGGANKLQNAITPAPGKGCKNLYLLTAGPTPPNPAELLSMGPMTALMRALKSKFDVIVIDTPPLGHVTDPLLITKHVDATIFVVRNLATERKMLRLNSQALVQAMGKRVGLVLNHMDMLSRHYYYNEYHNYYYGGAYGNGDGGTNGASAWDRLKEKVGMN